MHLLGKFFWLMHCYVLKSMLFMNDGASIILFYFLKNNCFLNTTTKYKNTEQYPTYKRENYLRHSTYTSLLTIIFLTILHYSTNLIFYNTIT